MTLKLTVQRQAWLDHVRSTSDAAGQMVPVVKGNGYGFGRPILVEQAVALGHEIAVGTAYEARDVPSTHTPIVLTPIGIDLPTTLPSNSVLTVGSIEHVTTLRNAGWTGRVMVKLLSSVKRYGVSPAELDELTHCIADAHMQHYGWSLHLPLDGDTTQHLAEASQWIAQLPRHLPLHISHLGPDSISALRAAHPTQTIVARLGTTLWLGDKSNMHLAADVLAVHHVTGGTAGYRNTAITTEGAIVVIGAGTAHGVTPLAHNASPFHFGRQRMQLLEPSHMHTSMLFVPAGNPCPAVGDVVDVQQPLTRVFVDTITWS
jgi:alanine racemase